MREGTIVDVASFDFLTDFFPRRCTDACQIFIFKVINRVDRFSYMKEGMIADVAPFDFLTDFFPRRCLPNFYF